MKKIKVILFLLLIAGSIFGIYICLKKQRNDLKVEQDGKPSIMVNENYLDSIINNMGLLTNYNIELTVKLNTNDDEIIGTYLFNIDTVNDLTKINAKLASNEETIEWNPYIDTLKNLYYYDDTSPGMMLHDKTTIESIYDIVSNAKERNDETFLADKELISKYLNNSSIKYYGKEKIENIVVDSDVEYKYLYIKMGENNYYFDKISTSFMFNNDYRISLDYRFTYE